MGRMGASSSSLLLSSLELSETKVYDPQIRARLGTADGEDGCTRARGSVLAHPEFPFERFVNSLDRDSKLSLDRGSKRDGEDGCTGARGSVFAHPEFQLERFVKHRFHLLCDQTSAWPLPFVFFFTTLDTGPRRLYHSTLGSRDF